jgi:quercetin dioxygenase-like cupin family protein
MDEHRASLAPCDDPEVSYHVVRAADHSWEERSNPPGREDQPTRFASDLTIAASLTQSRARIWRYPPGARGRRHAERTQEEVFVVLEGALTMLLGEPPERVDLPPRNVVSVEPQTPLQLRNDSSGEVVVFVCGAPPVEGGGTLLDDPEP